MRRTFQLSISLLTLTLLGAVPASAQTVEEIVAKNLKAKGGVEMLKTTASVKMVGTFTIPGAPAPMTMTLVARRPNQVRREIKVGEQSMVSGFDGTAAWVKQGPGPAQVISGPQADQIRQGAEFDSVFLNYKDKGHTIELVGNETLNDKPVHHLKVTRKEGLVQHYYLDAQTGLEAKMEMETEQAGIKIQGATELSDYRTVGGRTVPFKMKQFSNGTPAGEIVFETIEFNVPIDDALFQAPAK